MVRLGMASARPTHPGWELGVCQEFQKSLLPVAVDAGGKGGVRDLRPNPSL